MLCHSAGPRGGGPEGERYTWARIYVGEVRDRRMARVCQFELEDEEAAFAYAEERVRATSSRLAVANKARERWDALWRAGRAHDVDVMVGCYAEPFEYDDRRRLRGNPLVDLRMAAERILTQYTEFEGRTLAVRGERLHLGWTRWSNEDGFETSYLIVHEVDEIGRFSYEGRFDEDDFEGAYRELARRYSAGKARRSRKVLTSGQSGSSPSVEAIGTGCSVSSPTRRSAS